MSIVFKHLGQKISKPSRDTVPFGSVAVRPLALFNINIIFLKSVVYLLYNSHNTFSTSPSELLPSNWNTDGTVYSIKYQNQENQTVILKVGSQDPSCFEEKLYSIYRSKWIRTLILRSCSNLKLTDVLVIFEMDIFNTSDAIPFLVCFFFSLNPFEKCDELVRYLAPGEKFNPRQHLYLKYSHVIVSLKKLSVSICICCYTVTLPPPPPPPLPTPTCRLSIYFNLKLCTWL